MSELSTYALGCLALAVTAPILLCAILLFHVLVRLDDLSCIAAAILRSRRGDRP